MLHPPTLTHRARGGSRGGAACGETAAVRRRQIVRRTHDLAGAGDRQAAGRARAGLLRLPAASRRQARNDARRPSRRDRTPDAVPPGNARCAGRARSAAAGRGHARPTRDLTASEPIPIEPLSSDGPQSERAAELQRGTDTNRHGGPSGPKVFSSRSALRLELASQLCGDAD